MYKFRILIYNDNILTDDFFIGNKNESYYADEDMKFLNLNYVKNIPDALANARKQKKKWWQKMLLWQSPDYFKNIEEIKKYYNIEIRAGAEVIILANPLNLRDF